MSGVEICPIANQLKVISVNLADDYYRVSTPDTAVFLSNSWTADRPPSRWAQLDVAPGL